LLFRPKSESNDNVMVFGLVAPLVAAVCVSFVAAALESSAATNIVGSPSASSTNNAWQHLPPNDNWVYFYLVDTTSNATLFRLHDGEKVDNYFLKGIPVSVRVDVRERTRHVPTIRLIYNGGGTLEGVTTMSRPLAFGGTAAAMPADGFRFLLPLPWLGQFGRHTFTAILVDEYGFDFVNHTITISVVPETIPPGHHHHHQLFMDAPERNVFLQRLLQSRSGATGRCSTTSSNSNGSVVKNSVRKSHRIAPSPRRVRLGSLSLKHFLRSRKRKRSR
jgi:hypothetical protein